MWNVTVYSRAMERISFGPVTDEMKDKINSHIGKKKKLTIAIDREHEIVIPHEQLKYCIFEFTTDKKPF